MLLAGDTFIRFKDPYFPNWTTFLITKHCLLWAYLHGIKIQRFVIKNVSCETLVDQKKIIFKQRGIKEESVIISPTKKTLEENTNKHCVYVSVLIGI